MNPRSGWASRHISPDDYIPDANQRLYFYKRLASLEKPTDLDDLKAEIKDRFGPYPPAVENLFLVMNLRRVLKESLVQQISVSEGRVYLLFHQESPVKVEKLLDLIKKEKKKYRLAPDGRLSFALEAHDWEKVIDEVIVLLNAIKESESQRDLFGASPGAAP